VRLRGWIRAMRRRRRRLPMRERLHRRLISAKTEGQGEMTSQALTGGFRVGHCRYPQFETRTMSKMEQRRRAARDRL
jgi:hypothetical protein